MPFPIIHILDPIYFVIIVIVVDMVWIIVGKNMACESGGNIKDQVVMVINGGWRCNKC